jgi:uncharacterized membrane protein YhdT
VVRRANLKIEQIAHTAPNRDTEISYGLSRFIVPLDFDGSSKWLIGRMPDVTLFPDYSGLQCIYLPSLYVTRTLACIHASKQVYDGMHFLEGLNDRQPLFDLTTDMSFKKRPMRHGDRFGIVGLTFFTFRYVCVEDNDPSGDLGKDTVY